MCASPPLDILLEVFRRLDVTDVVGCAAACKPWRRAIIANALSLRPRPDRFLPDLLLGFFHDHLDRKPGVWLQPAAGPPPSEPAVAADLLAPYDTPVSCRDGLLLQLKRSSNNEVVDGLCLYNAMTSDHTFLPAAAFEDPDSYVLVTGHDLISPSGVGARVVAVKAEYTNDHNLAAISHQQLFLTSGSWVPVKRSPEFRSNLSTDISPGNKVVCGGAIHWLGMWTTELWDWFDNDMTAGADEIQGYSLAVDVLTGRTRATKLPDECRFGYSSCTLVLATTADGRLSVVRDCRGISHGDYIQVWVRIGEEQWALERTVAVPAYNFYLRRWKNDMVFCPRSGCVLPKGWWHVLWTSLSIRDGLVNLLLTYGSQFSVCHHENYV